MSLRSGNETSGGGCGSRDKDTTEHRKPTNHRFLESIPPSHGKGAYTKAMETVEFVYLDNVPGFNKEFEENLHKAASWFFSLPVDEKLHCVSKEVKP